VPSTDPRHFQAVAARRAVEIPNAVLANQFYNPANVQAHYETTGPEIWLQTREKVDGFICCSGTGGTISGTTKYLKEKNAAIKCYLIDPPSQAIEYIVKDNTITLKELSADEKSKLPTSIIEGIGSSKLYYPLSITHLDGVLRGTDKIAVEMCNYLLKEEGFFVGPSSGLNIVGAVWLAKILGPGHTIVSILCDSGANYRSTIFNKAWLEEKCLVVENTHTPEYFLNAFTDANVKVML